VRSLSTIPTRSPSWVQNFENWRTRRASRSTKPIAT
jgi:hypothetical protein